MVNDVPVPKDEPPDDAVYQLIIPALAVAAKTTVPLPQTEPGVVADIVGIALFVKITISETEQAPSVIVHCKFAEVPAGTPVTPEMGDEGVVIDAVPDIKDHIPAPELGVLPAKVKLPLLQFA